MLELILLNTFCLSILLIIYHHLGYPLLLRKVCSNKQPQKMRIKTAERCYQHSELDDTLPSITIIVPAYNEQQWIAEKIRNMACLDYPRDKLKVIIACDGCTDDTTQLAQQTIQEAICAETLFIVHNHPTNRGKVAVINEEIAQSTSDIIALSDASALLSYDSLLLAAHHFQDANVGVVNATYQILSSDNLGETTYWKYQSQLKYGESIIGSAIGAHGAFYTFRTQLFSPLEPGIINDDFILPMRIVLKGYHAVYEPRMLALELEASNDATDFKRRLRISAGNMQQLIKLRTLLRPRYRGTAFTFVSGKVLRLATPYLMLACLISSLSLSHNTVFAILSGGQVALYLIAVLSLVVPSLNTIRVFKIISYVLLGHAANLTGGMRYLLGLENKPWTRLNQ
ncbi:glycosyltransferase family 2 protein [Vibrio sp. CAU 1672]|uniref:glycosyltransferase family 2 protein n=1 Tax=Vibrio sp. CAU 1672 TaxID=3032594 RepID=UPI0023DBE824|nr:glycosyltransferase family 2 protein [Vibrio sp. CAU 1672]MDF2152227.1 glycosyltransferase family 2 protein [Vibrio sp. CAU 1672]